MFAALPRNLQRPERIEITCETARVDSNARMRYLGCCGYCVVGDFIPARKPRPKPTDCDSRKWCGRRPARLLLDWLSSALVCRRREVLGSRTCNERRVSTNRSLLERLARARQPCLLARTQLSTRETAHPVLLDLGQNNRDDNAGCRASKGGGLCATILLQEKTASNFPGRMPEDAHPSMSSALSARRSSYSRRAGCFGTPAIIGMQSVIM
jgi:hypothetical protein